MPTQSKVGPVIGIAVAGTNCNDGSPVPGREATAMPRKKGAKIGKILGALVAVSGLVLAILGTAGGKSTESYLTSRGTPTCADPKWLLQVPDDQIYASAFYVHEPFSANQTIDGDQNMAWLQWWPTTDFNGNKPGYNYIQWNFYPSNYNLRLICIVDGWNRDIVAYDRTEPIRKATVGFGGNSCPVYKKTFSNNGFMGGLPAEWQQVKVLCRTSQVRLVVDSTYKAVAPRCVAPPPNIGTSKCKPLTGISEVRFYYSPDWLRWVGWSAPIKQ
jgi:hypothetical protein